MFTPRHLSLELRVSNYWLSKLLYFHTWYWQFIFIPESDNLFSCVRVMIEKSASLNSLIQINRLHFDLNYCCQRSLDFCMRETLRITAKEGPSVKRLSPQPANGDSGCEVFTLMWKSGLLGFVFFSFIVLFFYGSWPNVQAIIFCCLENYDWQLCRLHVF